MIMTPGSDITFALMLSKSIVRDRVGDLISKVEFHRLAVPLIKYLQGKTEDVEWGSIFLFLSHAGYQPAEIETFRRIYESISATNEDELIKRAYSYISKKYIYSLIKRLTKDEIDINEFIDEIKRIQEPSSNYQILVASEVSPIKLFEEDLGVHSVIPSSFDFVNESLQSGGYLRGELIMVVGSPSAGKSTFILQELSNMAKVGYKTLYIALGDMMRYDVIRRTLLYLTKEPVPSNPEIVEEKWKELPERFKDNFYFVVVPAGVMTPSEIKKIIDDVNPDVVGIDYDSNAKLSTPDLYTKHDELYNILMQSARPTEGLGRVIFVGSQAKVSYWDDDILPLSSASESSRKQAISDIIITIGRNTKAEEIVGYLYIAKSRRGGAGTKVPYRLTKGYFEIIDEQTYHLAVGV